MPTNCERMTVKQVAEKVYGPIPDGATLYELPTFDNPNSDAELCICVELPRCYALRGGEMELFFANQIGPDISDRPASSFVGFFGKEFDQEIGSSDQES